MVYIHFICRSKTNQSSNTSKLLRKRLEKEQGPLPSPPSFPPSQLLTLPSNLAVAPSLMQRFRGGKMKAGAAVRGMEPTLEWSTLREVLETCVEAASVTSPMVCKQEGRPGQMTQNVQPCFPSGGSGPSVLVGFLCCGFYREQVPH